MKKIVGCVLCLAMLLCISACGYNQSDNTNSTNVNNTSSELSDKEKYDNAVVFFTEKKYQEAIGILENIDYENSKDLKKLISYVYACELFNKQEFSTAYDYFKKSEDYLDSQKKLNMSAYYEGVKLVNGEQHWKAIDWFRKVLNDEEFKASAEKHIIEITTSLIGNAWFGSYTNSNGATLQIEFKYFRSRDNLYIAHADKSNGYKQVASINGSLEVGAEKSKYYHSETTFGGTWDAIEFSFDSANRMYVYCSAKSIGKAITGFYSAKYTPSVYYKIDISSYPTLTIPEIDINGNIKNSNSSDESVSASSTESSVSKVDENSATSTNANSSNNDNKGTNSKPNNSSNNTNTKPSNNTNTSSKPTTTHTHSYSKATCTKPATCSCGHTSEESLGHLYKTVNEIVCVRCQKFSSKALNKLNDITWELPTIEGNVMRVKSATISNCKYSGGDKFTVFLNINVEFKVVFNGGLIEYYAYDHNGNQIYYGKTTKGGLEGDVFTVSTLLELPINTDLSKIKIKTY